MRRNRSKRPPFENRWTSGERGWRWYLALENLGVETVRTQLALTRVVPVNDLSELGVPPGFVRDWLRFHERRARRSTTRWRALIALVTAVAAVAATIAAWPTMVRLVAPFAAA